MRSADLLAPFIERPTQATLTQVLKKALATVYIEKTEIPIRFDGFAESKDRHGYSAANALQLLRVVTGGLGTKGNVSGAVTEVLLGTYQISYVLNAIREKVSPPTVLIAEGVTPTPQGLEALLTAQGYSIYPNPERVAVGTHLYGNPPPDLVIMPITPDSPSDLRDLRAVNTRVAIIVASAMAFVTQSGLIDASKQAGANGYIYNVDNQRHVAHVLQSNTPGVPIESLGLPEA